MSGAELTRDRVAGADPALEMAATHALLRRASRGVTGAHLRVYRPTPMVAFGRRDTNRPGFAQAAAACREAGFEPVVRPAGGRAVACTSAALVCDHVQPDPESLGGMEDRFVDYGAMLAGVLNDLGVDARVGEVPGEYCPGAHSVNARGEVKLIGTAQRMVRDAWLFSSVVVLDDAPVLRPLLFEVYAALEVPFDPASVGSIVDEGVTPADLEAGIVAAYDDRLGLREAALPEGLLDEAEQMMADHRVP